LFGGRRTKKELRDLKDEHHDLEERFDSLQREHERLQHEAGEETNVRISYIEEEIESMNQRVEKLATDSYEIRGEVRDIHESVMGMQTSLSEIVKLYKAIITQYGFGDMKAQAARARKAPAKPGEDPGDAIIRALEEEEGRSRGRPKGRPKGRPEKGAGPRGEAGSGKEGDMAASPPPRPRPAPMSSNALDELHRLSEEERGRRSQGDGEELAAKLVARSGTGDKVDRVARRDLGRAPSNDIQRDGEFTRSLPKKDLRPRAETREERSKPGDGWESMEPPPTETGKRKRPKPKLHDLLSPE
jgi:hypothetical protein